MRSRRSLALVVDASVLRSAGTTEHPVSRACRTCLEVIHRICHRVVWTRDLADERKRHASRFGRTWYSSMVARKKVVWNPETVPVEFSEDNLTDSDLAAVAKDRHLLEAALGADRVIVTRDTSLQRILRRTRPTDRAVRRLVEETRWLNPETDALATQALLELADRPLPSRRIP